MVGSKKYEMATCHMMPRAKLKNGLSESFERRFLSRVTKTKTCWIWNGLRAKNGYGRISFGGKSTTGLAHRASWIFHNKRKIPKGMEVLHSCDNPPCVNPNHLSLGTQVENLSQAIKRGRCLIGEDHPGAKLSNKDVRVVKRLLGEINRKSIAKMFGVSSTLIDRIAWGIVRKIK